MIKTLSLSFLLSVFTLFSHAVAANHYADAIRSFSNAGETADYFKTAYGYAVFPTVGKGGLVVGGAHGEGKVFVGDKHVGDSTVTQVSVGAQVGGQAFSQCFTNTTGRAGDDGDLIFQGCRIRVHGGAVSRLCCNAP